MVFVEATSFTKLLPDYLDDEEYRGLQAHLMKQPDTGAVIRGSGGVRKVIYYWVTAEGQILMLTIYGKSEKEDLSAADLKRIVKLVAESTNG